MNANYMIQSIILIYLFISYYSFYTHKLLPIDIKSLIAKIKAIIYPIIPIKDMSLYVGLTLLLIIKEEDNISADIKIPCVILLTILFI